MNATAELLNKPKTESREVTWRGMQVEVQGKFTQARPTPTCPNPDRASFADQGDPAEVNVTGAFFLKPGSMSQADRIPLSAEMLAQMLEEIDLVEELRLRG